MHIAATNPLPTDLNTTLPKGVKALGGEEAFKQLSDLVSGQTFQNLLMIKSYNAQSGEVGITYITKTEEVHHKVDVVTALAVLQKAAEWFDKSGKYDLSCLGQDRAIGCIEMAHGLLRSFNLDCPMVSIPNIPITVSC